MEVNGDQQLFGSSKFFQISSFVFNIRKKLIQVWNDRLLLLLFFLIVMQQREARLRFAE